MDNKKKKNNILERILLILFIMFICLYGISKNGYLESKYNDKTLYTEDMIKEFEQDVKNKKEIDLRKYIANEEKDYATGSSKLGESISNTIDKGAKKGLEGIFSVFNYLFG